ncbi:MAG: magnesium/cobalt transporter CorA [Alphaproteobacteria bacterium]|nr:magnesium/cobalt transporter CorA [Alphaproteobacteria bacterium]
MPKVQLHEPGTGQTRFGGLELVDAWEASGDALLWIDLDEPSEREEAALMRRFGIHPRAIEDAQAPRHPPKAEDFGDILFLLIKGLDAETDSISFGTIQIAIFAGRRFMLTRHGGPSPSIARLWARTEQEPALLGQGPSAMAIELVGIVMDRFLPILLAVEDRLDWLEDEVAERPRDELLSELISLKSNLTRMRRITTYHTQMCAQVTGSPPAAFDDGHRHDLRDLYEKLERLTSLTGLYYDLSSDLMDGYISLASHRLNNIMKVLTIVASIFIPLTFLAGVYGMNFQNIPELHYRYSYYILIAVMVALAAGLLTLFRRKRWL